MYSDEAKPVPEGVEDMHRISIHLPADAQYDTEGLAPKYKFIVPKAPPENKYVFADQPKPQEDGEPPTKRARTSPRSPPLPIFPLTAGG